MVLLHLQMEAMIALPRLRMDDLVMVLLGHRHLHLHFHLITTKGPEATLTVVDTMVVPTEGRMEDRIEDHLGDLTVDLTGAVAGQAVVDMGVVVSHSAALETGVDLAALETAFRGQMPVETAAPKPLTWQPLHSSSQSALA